MDRCPYCSNRLILDEINSWFVCTNCGRVFNPYSNVTFDSYLNFTFMDDWRRREEKLRRRRFTWLGVVSSEGGDSKAAMLVKYHILELLRNKSYSKYIQPVREYTRASSVKVLFQDFLKVTGLDYREARSIFEEACRRACIELPDLSPTSLNVSESYFRIRNNLRRRRIEEAYRRIEVKWGEDIARAVRILSSLPLFQPEDPEPLGYALMIYLGRLPRKSAKNLRKIDLRLKRLRKLAKYPMHILVQLVGLEVAGLLRGLSRRSLVKMSSPSYVRRNYALKRYRKVMERNRLSDVYLKAIEILRERPLKPRELADKLGISNSYARVVIHRLKLRGIVERTLDGRYSLVMERIAGLNVINSYSKVMERKAEFSVKLDPEELVKYYKTYPGYVKGCKKLGLKPLSRKRFLQEKFILKNYRKAVYVLNEILLEKALHFDNGTYSIIGCYATAPHGLEKQVSSGRSSSPSP